MCGSAPKVGRGHSGYKGLEKNFFFFRDKIYKKTQSIIAIKLNFLSFFFINILAKEKLQKQREKKRFENSCEKCVRLSVCM